MRTLIGLFGDRIEAERNIQDLKRLGARDRDISVVSPEANVANFGVRMTPVELPGIGRVAASGPMTAYLNQQTATEAPDTLLAALVDMGVPDEDARRYIAGVQHGYTLEAIGIEDEKAAEALEVMREHALAEHRPEHSSKAVAAARARAQAEGTGEEEILPVIVEELRVGKREVDKGGVRVRSKTEEIPVEEEVTLREEHVDVERRTVDRPISAGDESFQDRDIEVTARAEEPVVSKEARVVEEVVVKKGATERTETIRDTVRRTDVDVERFDPSLHREHYQSTFGASGDRFEEYEPAYRFGHELRGSEASARDWSEVETNAQSRWESKKPGTWTRFKDAVRHAWERAKT